jgi:hypothetical protein
MTPNAIRKREQRERDRLAKQTTGGGGAFNQMANTVTTPTTPAVAPTTTPPQDNTDPQLSNITDDEIASSIANMDDTRLQRAATNPALDPRVKTAVDAELAKRNSIPNEPSTKPKQATTKPATPVTAPVQNTQQAQPSQSLWNKLKGGVKGAIAGIQQSQANRAATTNPVSKEMAQRELQSWQTFLSQYVTGIGGKLTPEVIQQAAQQFTTNRYKAAGSAVLGKVNTVKDAKSANDFITQAFNMAMVNQKTGVTAEPADSKPTSVPQVSTPQTGASTAGTWIDTPDGIQIKPASGANPTFAKYNKQLYRLTNDDRWVDVRDKPVSQTMMAALNNALEQT